MRTRLAAIAVIALSALLALAPAGAMAADGVGTYGRTDDKVITFFAFGVMAFFAILVIGVVGMALDRCFAGLQKLVSYTE